MSESVTQNTQPTEKTKSVDAHIEETPSSKEEPSAKEESNSQSTSTENTKPAETPISDSATKVGLSLGSYDSLLNEVKAEEEAKKEARKSMSIELVEKVWSDYINQIESASVKVAMKNSFRSLEGRTITVLVATENGKNIILQEDHLKDLLREQLGAEDLILDVIVDKSKFPDIEEEKPKTLYTNREKYELMADKNPLLAELRTKFELKIDK